MELNEKELEKKLLDDPDAFGHLYELNYKRILNYLLYSTGDVELARDLTSETFFKALRALRGFKYRGGSFTAWLYRIASREIAMHYRKMRVARAIHFPLTSCGEKTRAIISDELNREALEAKREIERSEDFLILSQPLKNLPSRQREVIFLRFFEGRSIEEISQMLGRPNGTVKSQIHYAMKRLRREIQPLSGGMHLNKRGLETSTGTSTLQEEVE